MKVLLVLAVIMLFFSCSVNNKIRFVRVDRVKTEKSPRKSKAASDEAKTTKQIDVKKQIEEVEELESSAVAEVLLEGEKSSPSLPRHEVLTDEGQTREVISQDESYPVQNSSAPSEVNNSDSQESSRMSKTSRVLLIILFTIAALGLLSLVLLLAFLVGWNGTNLQAILIILAGLAIIVTLYIYAIRQLS